MVGWAITSQTNLPRACDNINNKLTVSYVFDRLSYHLMFDGYWCCAACLNLYLTNQGHFEHCFVPMTLVGNNNWKKCLVTSHSTFHLPRSKYSVQHSAYDMEMEDEWYDIALYLVTLSWSWGTYWPPLQGGPFPKFYLPWIQMECFYYVIFCCDYCTTAFTIIISLDTVFEIY